MIVRTPLVRGGRNAKLEPISNHRAFPVYTEMYLQICREYSSLPDPRSLSASEIKFYYEGLRADLKKATKPQKQS